MGITTIFEKGGGLIAVTGMMQIIAVIVNNTVMTRVVFRPFILINSFDCNGFLHVLFVIKIRMTIDH